MDEISDITTEQFDKISDKKLTGYTVTKCYIGDEKLIDDTFISNKLKNKRELTKVYLLLAKQHLLNKNTDELIQIFNNIKISTKIGKADTKHSYTQFNNELSIRFRSGKYMIQSFIRLIQYLNLSISLEIILKNGKFINLEI